MRTVIQRSIEQLFSWPLVLLPIVAILAMYATWSSPIEVGGDAIGSWNWSKEAVASGTPDLTLWWHTRWFIQLRAVPTIMIFGDAPIVYYIGPMLTVLVFLAVFCFLAGRFFGPYAVMGFLLLYLVEPELWRQTFQILPSSHTLLSLALFAISYYAYTKTRTYWVFGLVILACYSLIGSKSTHAFLIAGFGVALLFRREYKLLALLVGGTIMLYVLETLYFLLISQGDSPLLGRVQILLENASLVNEARPERTTGLTVGDLLTRWTRVGYMTRFTYLLFFALGTIFIWQTYRRKRLQRVRWNNDPEMQEFMFVMVWVGLIFALLSTFFVSSIHPLNVAMSFQSRYTVPLLPIAYMTILWGLDWLRLNWRNPRRQIRRLARISALFLLVQFFLVMLMYRPWRLPLFYEPVAYNVWTANDYFAQITDHIADDGCFAVTTEKDLQLLPLLLTADQIDRLASRLPLEDHTIQISRPGIHLPEDAVPDDQESILVYAPVELCPHVMWYGRLDTQYALSDASVNAINARR